jgi:hypothetical protein
MEIKELNTSEISFHSRREGKYQLEKEFNGVKYYSGNRYKTIVYESAYSFELNKWLTEQELNDLVEEHKSIILVDGTENVYVDYKVQNYTPDYDQFKSNPF